MQMQDFENETVAQAVNFFGSEAIRAEMIREAMEGDGDLESTAPLLPAGWSGEVPVPSETREALIGAVRDYETAMKALLGHYSTASAREQVEAQQRQQIPAGFGRWGR